MVDQLQNLEDQGTVCQEIATRQVYMVGLLHLLKATPLISSTQGFVRDGRSRRVRNGSLRASTWSQTVKPSNRSNPMVASL